MSLGRALLFRTAVFLAVVTLTIVFVNFTVFGSVESEAAAGKVSQIVDKQVVGDIDIIEELESSCQQETKVAKKVFPSVEQKKLIGRIASGILKVKLSNGNIWFFCGEKMEGEEAQNLAIKWAYTIVHSAWVEEIDPPNDATVYGYSFVELTPFKMNPWGVAGLTLNESGFDLCALGMGPRFKAYSLGLVKRKKTGISLSRDEVVTAISDKKMLEAFKKTSFDLGGLQELSKYHRDKNPEFLLTWEGFRKQIHYLANRGRIYNTSRPWKYWPGHEAAWKDKKVTAFARRLGATKQEI